MHNENSDESTSAGGETTPSASDSAPSEAKSPPSDHVEIRLRLPEDVINLARRAGYAAGCTMEQALSVMAHVALERELAVDREQTPTYPDVSALREALDASSAPQGGGEACNCPGEGKLDPALHAPNCPVRTSPPSAPIAQGGGEAVTRHSDQRDDGAFDEYVVFGRVAPWDADEANSVKCADAQEADKLYRLISAPPSAPVGVEAAKHWHSLYRKECQLRQDDAARYGQQIVDLEALAQQPAAVDEAICPVCERLTDIRHCQACGCDFTAGQQPAAVGDTRRLEWLIANELLAHRLSDTGQWMITNADLSPAIYGGEYDTPREAIDAGIAALAAQPGEE